MNEVAACYEVCGSPKGHGREAMLVLRRFATEDDAVKHALKVNMDVWEDVWVRAGTKSVAPEVTAPPPYPWSVLWQGGFAYIVDADGKKIGSLLGPQKQREFVAGIICNWRHP